MDHTEEKKLHKVTSLVVENDESGRVDGPTGLHPDFLECMRGLADLKEFGNIKGERKKKLNKIAKNHAEVHPDYGEDFELFFKT